MSALKVVWGYGQPSAEKCICPTSRSVRQHRHRETAIRTAHLCEGADRNEVTTNLALHVEVVLLKCSSGGGPASFIRVEKTSGRPTGAKAHYEVLVGRKLVVRIQMQKATRQQSVFV
jgi:hypothetical protein